MPLLQGTHRHVPWGLCLHPCHLRQEAQKSLKGAVQDELAQAVKSEKKTPGKGASMKKPSASPGSAEGSTAKEAKAKAKAEAPPAAKASSTIMKKPKAKAKAEAPPAEKKVQVKKKEKKEEVEQVEGEEEVPIKKKSTKEKKKKAEHKEDAKDGNDEGVKDEEVKAENFVESKSGAIEKEGAAKKRQKIMVDEENDCDEGGEEEAKESDPLVFPANIQLTRTVMQQRTKFCKAASSFTLPMAIHPKKPGALLAGTGWCHLSEQPCFQTCLLPSR